MIISNARLAELAAMPDSKIDTSEIPEADETFFKSAKLRQPTGSRRGHLPSVSVSDTRTSRSTKA
jgi:hypothetical protein